MDFSFPAYEQGHGPVCTGRASPKAAILSRVVRHKSEGAEFITLVEIRLCGTALNSISISFPLNKQHLTGQSCDA
jgi:hypothetical protein